MSSRVIMSKIKQNDDCIAWYNEESYKQVGMYLLIIFNVQYLLDSY